MKWIDKLERKYRRFAIPNLMKYLVFGMGIVFILATFSNAIYVGTAFIPELIFQGQVWRIFTFIFWPPTSNLIFIIFVLMFYYYIGKTLEQVWGTFKFNMYYLIGFLITVIVGLVFNLFMTVTYLNLSLFLAYATLFPERQVRLYMIIPVKVKWLAWLNMAFFVYTILFGTMGERISALAGLANYFIFFGKDLYKTTRGKVKQTKRRQAYERASERKPKARTTARGPVGGDNVRKVSFHKCYICGITELDDPNMEFRYCSKCEGYKEYCSEHLYNHDHS